MGKFFIFCHIQLKFHPRVRLKCWNVRGEFELDRSKSKNNIAENSVALGHDTHNTMPDFIPKIIHRNMIFDKKSGIVVQFFLIIWLSDPCLHAFKGSVRPSEGLSARTLYLWTESKAKVKVNSNHAIIRFLWNKALWWGHSLKSSLRDGVDSNQWNS